MFNVIEQLRRKYGAIRRVLGSPLKFQTEPQHDGSAHVECSAEIYRYVITERGSELERRTTKSQDEILYWLASDMAFDLAGKFELQNRVVGQDPRRLMFAKEVELLSSIHPEWGERKTREYAATLSEYPYVDRAEG